MRENLTVIFFIFTCIRTGGIAEKMDEQLMWVLVILLVVVLIYYMSGGMSASFNGAPDTDAFMFIT
jgi:predicted membrane protein